MTLPLPDGANYFLTYLDSKEMFHVRCGYIYSYNIYLHTHACNIIIIKLIFKEMKELEKNGTYHEVDCVPFCQQIIQ